MTRKFSLWKQSLEGKGLRVNLGKTKVMVSLGGRARKLHQSGKHPCGICFKGVGSNSIYCGHCKNWIHHRPCSGIKGRLKPNPDYVCRRCLWELPPSPVFTLRVLTLRQYRTSATLVILLETLVAV